MNEPKVGEALPDFTMEGVTLQQVIDLMELMNDTNPVHVDAALADRLGLRGPVAQGPASLAYAMNMLLGWRGDTFLERFDFRFHETVTVGDTVTATGVIEEVDGERVRCGVSVDLQTGVEAVSGAATLRLRPTSDG